MNWSDLSKITLKDFSIGLFSSLLLITPGFLSFFIFDQGLFLRLDIGRLIILSLAVIETLVIFNFLILQKKEESTDSKTSSFTYLVLSIFISVLVIDFSLLLKYELNFNTRVFVFVTIIIQALAACMLYFIQKSETE